MFECRQGSQFVLILDGDDMPHVGWTIERRATQGHDEVRFGLEDLVDSRRGLPVPPWPREHVRTDSLACRAGPAVGKVGGEQVDPLEYVISLVWNFRHAQYPRFATQVQPRPRIRGVIVRRDDLLVLGSVGSRVIAKLSESADISP